MKLYILDNEYNTLAYIDQAESVLWNKKYNDVGECEVYISANAEMAEILKIGNYVYREDDDMFCKIKHFAIETDVERGDYIVATGQDIVSILADRIVRWEVTYSGTVAEFIKKLIVENLVEGEIATRKINNVIVNDSNFNELTDTIEIRTVAENLLELIRTVCKTYEYGFRVKFLVDTKQLEFSLYKGKDKASISSNEYVEFSPTYANILSSKYTKDDNNYKNLCYIGYKDSDDNFQLMSVFNTEVEPEGENRREIYVDGTSTSRNVTVEELEALFGELTRTQTGIFISQNVYRYRIAYSSNGVEVGVAIVDPQDDTTEELEENIVATDYTYLLLIRNIGNNTLAEHKRIQQFSGEIDTVDSYEYKEDWNLGDVVKVINEYGIEAEARIVEIMESDDVEDGYVIEPVFEYIE